MNPSTKTLLGFTDCRLPCLIGIHPHEQGQPQEVCISLTLSVDLKGTEDDLHVTTDYAALERTCSQVTQKKHYALVETLARELLDEVEKEFSPLWIHVRIEKPAALPSARCAFVEMERLCPTHL